MSSISLIGLTGWAGAGKSTVAEILVRDHGYTEMTFAAPMIDGLHTLDPIIGWVAGEPVRFAAAVDALGWDTTKRTYGEARRLAQRFGTDVVRNQIGVDTWVDVLRHRLNAHGDKSPVVVPDMRFPNEARLIRECGGVLARIERPGLYQQQAGAHESEQYAMHIMPDYVILNAGDMSNLRQQVDHLLGELDKQAEI